MGPSLALAAQSDQVLSSCIFQGQNGAVKKWSRSTEQFAATEMAPQEDRENAVRRIAIEVWENFLDLSALTPIIR
jgi:hypothetical protein